MSAIRARAFAKINWTLQVTGVRDDGYHLLNMVMQSVSLHDTLILEPANRLSLHVEGSELAADEHNLVIRAARMLMNRFPHVPGARMTLKKRIFEQAGMGGGSADCAAALVGLSRLWNLPLTLSQLEGMGARLGADVPFCVRGGLQMVSGIGEKLQPLPSGVPIHLIAAHPGAGLSTPEIFRAWDRAPVYLSTDARLTAQAIQNGDLHALARRMGNALQPAAVERLPVIQNMIDDLKEAGALAAQMTGSGSAVIGFFSQKQQAAQALEALRVRYPLCEAMETVPTGVEIVEE